MNEGDWLDVEIFKITAFGAFVKLPNNKKGLIHISQLSDEYVKDINSHFKVGDKVNARVITIAKDGKIDLTLRKEPNRPKARQSAPSKNNSSNNKGGGFKFLPFEDKFDKFLEQIQPEPVEAPK